MSANQESEQTIWLAILEKYQDLVYSVPVLFGLSREEASAVFGEVFLDWAALQPCRDDPEVLPHWLLNSARDKSLGRIQRHVGPAGQEESRWFQNAADEILREALADWNRRRALNTAVLNLPPRCRRVVEMLFTARQAISCAQVLKTVGAKAEPDRCLERLRTGLEAAKFLATPLATRFIN